jgi:hypothetical protein
MRYDSKLNDKHLKSDSKLGAAPTNKLKVKAEKYRDLILLLEIGAFIHDLGKLSSFFIISKAKGAVTRDFHGQILFIDLISYGKVIPKCQAPGNKKLFPFMEFLFTPIYKLLNFPQIVDGIDLSISLSHFVCAHHGCSRCLYGLARNKLKDAFPTSIKECPFKDRIDNHPLIALLKTVDHLDASNPADSGKQGFSSVMIDQFFYGEKEVLLKKLNGYRINFYRGLNNFLAENFPNIKNFQKIYNSPSIQNVQQCKNGSNFIFNHQDIVNLNKFVKSLGEKYFSSTLSETRRYGNDITLLDHAKSVSSCFKMYLFNYLVRDKPLPLLFFNSQFRVLTIKNNSQDVEEMFSYELAFSNLVFKTDQNSHFLVPNMRKSEVQKLLHSGMLKQVLAFARKRVQYVNLPGVNDFSVIFNDTLKGKPLHDAFDKLKEMKIKTPEDLGFTEKELINELKRIVFFSALKKKEALERRLKSSLKHLENLKNGTIYNEKNLFKYYRKESEINTLRRHLNSHPTIEIIKYRTGWKSSRDAEKEVYDFFNVILSPIRPPSPIEMSNFFLKEYHRLGSFKGLYENLIIRRPLTPGRIYAFTRNMVKFIYEENKK